MDINELLNSITKINEKVNFSLTNSSINSQLQELTKKSDFGINSQILGSMMPISQIIKSNQFNNFLESQKKISKSLTALNSFSTIWKQNSVPKIPDSTIAALQGIVGLQNYAYLDALKTVGNLPSITKLINPSLEIQKISNLNVAFNSITSQLTEFALTKHNWEIIDDYESFVNEAVVFSENVSESSEIEFSVHFANLFDKFKIYYEKNKETGVFIYKILGIMMLLASMHQYYDFLKAKPELATKENIAELKQDISQLKDSQKITFQYVKEFVDKKGDVRDEFKLIRKSKISLKPNKKSRVINELPRNYTIEILKQQPTWILIKYIDPHDGILQVGWIRKENIRL